MLEATLGRRVATALAGAWRQSPPPWSVSPIELDEITPLLLRGGAGPLVWWRIRNSELGSSPSALLLQQAYRFHSLGSAVREQDLQRTVTRIRSCGVELLLAKGWAVARLYSEPGLRPYGDLDLYVPSEHHASALASLTSWEQRAGPVDLHRGFRDLEDRSVEDLYGHSRTVNLEGTEVRLLGPEDHLRLLCLHLLRHGASRPVWLCDIGAALESRPADFDWKYLFSGDPRRSQYVAGTLALAQRLLGARVDDTPVPQRVRGLPAWLVPAVLHEWGKGFRQRERIGSHPGHAAGLLEELRRHWPNPIEATARTGAPFNDLPRLPFQIANVLTRTARFARRRAA